jgi:hypothetical protein
VGLKAHASRIAIHNHILDTLVSIQTAVRVRLELLLVNGIAISAMGQMGQRQIYLHKHPNPSPLIKIEPDLLALYPAHALAKAPLLRRHSLE